MADDQALDGGTGTNPYTAAADDIAGVKYQRVKLRAADDGVAGSDVSAANPLPVTDAKLPAALGQTTSAASLAVTVANDQSAVAVSAPAAAPVAVRISDGSTAQTPVRVDNAAFVDNSSNITPAGYIFDEVAGTALTENDAAAARIDSKRAQVGVIEDATTRGQRAAVSAAGAVKTDGSAVTQPVSGTVTANAGSGPFPVSDNAGSLTIDAPVATPVASRLSDGAAFLGSGHGTAAAALRVELPTDGTGVVGLAAGAATIGSLAANQSINNAQVAGTAIDVNSGNKSAGTQRVVIATDQVALTNALKVDGSAVTQPVSVANPVQAATATLANVAASASSVTLLSSNAARKGGVIVNDSTSILYIKFGSAASTSSFTYFLAGSVSGVPATFEFPPVTYTGIVTGIWASAVGNARVTENT